jgi:hypothetical protein
MQHRQPLPSRVLHNESPPACSKPTVDIQLHSLQPFALKAMCAFSQQTTDAFRFVGGIWDTSVKAWIFPLTALSRLVDTLRAARITFEAPPSSLVCPFMKFQSLIVWFKVFGFTQANESQRSFADADLSPIPEALFDHLLDYQREGVSFVLQRHGRGIIADEMGALVVLLLSGIFFHAC